MDKTPQHIAMFIKQHVPEFLFTRHIQKMDLVELCFRYREVLEKDPAIMKEVNELRMQWWAKPPAPRYIPMDE